MSVKESWLNNENPFILMKKSNKHLSDSLNSRLLTNSIGWKLLLVYSFLYLTIIFERYFLSYLFKNTQGNASLSSDHHFNGKWSSCKIHHFFIQRYMENWQKVKDPLYINSTIEESQIIWTFFLMILNFPMRTLFP